MPIRTPRKEQDQLVDNSDAFFDSLPQTKNPTRGRFLFNSKAKTREQERVQKLKQEQQALESKLKQKREMIEALVQGKPQVSLQESRENMRQVLEAQMQEGPDLRELREGERIVDTEFGSMIVSDNTASPNIVHNIEMDHEEVKEADMAFPPIKKPTVRKKKNQQNL